MKNILFLIALFFVACNTPSEKTNDEIKKVDTALTSFNGEILFKANCASCHKSGMAFVGPALDGVQSRWENKSLLYDFVRNPQEVIVKNAYAKKLWEQYKQSQMIPFPQLKDEEIQSILDYCEMEK
jgi:mono/diheme cytochrome c family protein